MDGTLYCFTCSVITLVGLLGEDKKAWRGQRQISDLLTLYAGADPGFS